MCRELRRNDGFGSDPRRRYFKQREVAESIGVATSTYGNIESSRYMVVGEPGAKKLATFYGLTGPDREKFLAAWRKLPLSKHGEKRRKEFARRNSQRSKSKHHDLLMISLAEVLGLMFSVAPDPDTLCHCQLELDGVTRAGPLCEICLALDNLGLPPYSTSASTIAGLAVLQDKLEAARDKPAEGGAAK